MPLLWLALAFLAGIALAKPAGLLGWAWGALAGLGLAAALWEKRRLRRVIVDAHNVIPDGTSIGYDPVSDAQKYHVDQKSGIVVIGMPQIQLRKKLQIPGAYERMYAPEEDAGF